MVCDVLHRHRTNRKHRPAIHTSCVESRILRRASRTSNIFRGHKICLTSRTNLEQLSIKQARRSCQSFNERYRASSNFFNFRKLADIYRNRLVVSGLVVDIDTLSPEPDFARFIGRTHVNYGPRINMLSVGVLDVSTIASGPIAA